MWVQVRLVEMWVHRNLKVETDSTCSSFIMRVDLSVPPEVHDELFGLKDVQLQVIF